MTAGNTKILVVGPAWVGDMVMAQTLFRILAGQYPQLTLDVLAPAWAAPVLERMAEVHRAIDMPVGHGSLQLGVRYRLGSDLAGEGYDQAYVLPNSLKSALVPAFAEIPRRIGWRGEMRYGLLNDRRVLDKSRYPLMIERFAALAFAPGAALPEPLPWPRLQVDSENQQRLTSALGLDPGMPLMTLCPGARYGSSKQWPADYYAALAQHYIGAGWQVLVLGSDNDKAFAGRILGGLTDATRPACIDACGNTGLVDAVDLLALSQVVVTNDSGLMHIAAAVGSKIVAIYGSSTPAFTPPLADTVAIAALELDCRPCFERECPLGHLDCLRRQSPEAIIGQVEALLLQDTKA